MPGRVAQARGPLMNMHVDTGFDQIIRSFANDRFVCVLYLEGEGNREINPAKAATSCALYCTNLYATLTPCTNLRTCEMKKCVFW